MASTGGNLLQRTRCYLFLRHRDALQQARAGQRLLRDRRPQPHARDPRHERTLHRDPSVRYVRGAGGARRQGPCRPVRPASARSRSPIFIACPATRRSATPISSADEIVTAVELPAAGLRRELHLSENPRPAVLRVCARLRRGRARARGRHHQGGALGAGRRRAQAVARSPAPKPRCAARPRTRRLSRSAADVLLRDAKGYRAQRVQDRLARRAIVRALTQAAHGTPQSQSNKKIA